MVGLPGTGKTDIAKQIERYFKILGDYIKLINIEKIRQKMDEHFFYPLND